ncbi:unnamed protein product [Rotaria sp. Silwood2]|nr:unnamed protein product [Rotaria sp. Silwood2]CAF2936104.1 unnamed protein product [Rotaria sp. Silwood2]CAF3314318.1 unnamed protein product [Rotaria sp. Silwood2]CAF3903111.1 unnamed protein product [Rotaria sp. Silwood2]CAF3989826.1 unnamed protein product [Rotaria sp. Silwood2]
MNSQHQIDRSSSQSVPIVTTESASTLRILNKRRKQKKRCHGNRKLRRFKKKCRRRGMTDDTIKVLIDQYNHTRRGNPSMPVSTSINDQMDTVATTETVETRRKSKKRKRMTASESSRSISRQSRKKSKKKHVQINPVPSGVNDRPPKYLKKMPNLLFQALRLHINHKLNKKYQQQFIHPRLRLFDRQYRLELHRHLWESYSTLGSMHRLWTVSDRRTFYV